MRYVNRGYVLASNISSFPLTRIANATPRLDKILGMHLMDPVPVMMRIDVI